MTAGVQHQHPRQRPDFHRMALPARRFQPRIGLLDVEVLVRRFRSGVIEVGFAVVGVQPLLLAGFVVVPRMRDVLLDLLRRMHIDLVDGAEVAAEDRAGRDQVTRRVAHAVGWKVAVGQEVAETLATAAPVLVEAGDRQRIRHINLVDEGFHLRDDVLYLRQALGVDRRVRVQVDRAGHAADDEIGVRILAAEDGVQARDVALPGQCLEIMRYRHQVGCRWQLVRRVSPVGLGEDAELAGLDEVLELFLHVGEVAGGGLGVAGQRLRQCRGFARVGVERRHHVDPVERVQVVKVHHVIMDVLRAVHQVADQFGVLRDLVVERIFDRTNRCQAVDQRAYAADTLREGPRVARVAPAQYDLDAAHHGARRIGAGDAVAFHLRLDAQMPLDAGNRVYYDSICGCAHCCCLRLMR